MNRRIAKTILACALSVGWGTVASAAEEKPAEPSPKMEPQKLGPQTEQVDAKSYAKVLHVAPSGTDQGEGSDAKPFATVAGALASIKGATAENRYAILVAAGEYKGDTIVMAPFVDLFGGFDAKSWQRDINANRSVLNGEGQRRVIVGANNARLDGFVIQNGKVRGHGAGVLCDHASPTISNNTIINNVTLAPEALKENTMVLQPGNEGGGLACLNGSSPTITNNLIANNATEIGVGAGISVANYSLPHILNNVIVNNEGGLTDVHKSRSSSGGGISVSHAATKADARMTIVNNVIAHNKANGTSDAGGIFCEYDASPVIGANWILGNFATDDGGGIYVMKSSHPLITSNIVAGNNSSAIRLSKEGRGDLEHNLVFGNSSAVICISSWMMFKNNTIVDNQSGLTYANKYAPHLKPSVITENLFYGNQSGQLSPEPNYEEPIVTKNNVQGGFNGGEGNFDKKPQFIDDAVTGQALCGDYDQLQAVTTVTTVDLPADVAIQPGRVISLGDRWGVVKEAKGSVIFVWGDLRQKQPQAGPVQFKVASTYQLKTPVAGAPGIQIKP